MKKKENEKTLKDKYPHLRFHYNREERLAMADKNDENRNCFFCKKNRYLFITFINILLIVIIGYFYSFYISGNKKIIINGLEHRLTRKKYSRENVIDFTLEIKNTLESLASVEDPIMDFKLSDHEGNLVFEKEIIVSKLNYQPGEYYIENIIISSPGAGEYTAVLYLYNKHEIRIDFNIRK